MSSPKNSACPFPRAFVPQQQGGMIEGPGAAPPQVTITAVAADCMGPACKLWHAKKDECSIKLVLDKMISDSLTIDLPLIRKVMAEMGTKIGKEPAQ